jgi:hypothetical protein
MSEYVITDEHGESHCFQMEGNRLLLDQRPITAIHVDERQVTFVIDHERDEMTCALEACWYAFAGQGATPTAREAGQFLAAHLAHQTMVQHLCVLMQPLSLLIGAQPTLILPRPRLDPFIEAALDRCEQTTTLEKVTALAQVIDRPVELIITWLQQRGKTVVLPGKPEGEPEGNGENDPPPEMEDKAKEVTTEPLTAREAGGIEEGTPGKFSWSAQMLAQLRDDFLAMPATLSIDAAAQTIAERNNWPVEKTKNKIRNLHLNPLRKAQEESSRLPEQSGGSACQQDSAMIIQEAQGEESGAPGTEEQSVREVCVPTNVPVTLCRGNYDWEVHIADEIQRWPLDYPYGEFPARAGNHVRYQDRVYHLETVGTSMVRATIVVPDSAVDTADQPAQSRQDLAYAG